MSGDYIWSVMGVERRKDNALSFSYSEIIVRKKILRKTVL
jgi:hypothetical protein